MKEEENTTTEKEDIQPTEAADKVAKKAIADARADWKKTLSDTAAEALADPDVKKIGQVSDKKIEEWKKDYGDNIKVFVVPSEDGTEVSLAYFRPTTRLVVSQLLAYEREHDMQFQVVMNSLWLGGDPRFLGEFSDDENMGLQMAIILNLIPQLIETRYGMLKKL